MQSYKKKSFLLKRRKSQYGIKHFHDPETFSNRDQLHAMFLKEPVEINDKSLFYTKFAHKGHYNRIDIALFNILKKRQKTGTILHGMDAVSRKPGFAAVKIKDKFAILSKQLTGLILTGLPADSDHLIAGLVTAGAITLGILKLIYSNAHMIKPPIQ